MPTRLAPTTTAFRNPHCVDSLGAYMELREHGDLPIGAALALLCPPGPMTTEAFDAVADGLYLLRLERDEDELLAGFDIS
ncbi:MAG TPA: hypothetical protein VGI54_05795 [Solirubrobacteraceae bacterium]|jgi:hypothetical protein